MLTQRKTLKISRPGAVRPAGKFGAKKPEAAEGGDVPEVADVADIPEVADMPAAQPKFTPAAVPADAVADVSKGTNIASIIVQLAACAAVGVLGYFLFENMQLPLYLGGCGWGQ